MWGIPEMPHSPWYRGLKHPQGLIIPFAFSSQENAADWLVEKVKPTGGYIFKNPFGDFSPFSREETVPGSSEPFKISTSVLYRWRSLEATVKIKLKTRSRRLKSKA